MEPFVKTRSVWRGKWTFISIALIAVVVRLVQIEQPFVDPWSWRQSDVAGIARNYLENGFHFNRPQIDWAGTAEGYVGTEFPILPFAAAIAYKITGVQEWVGRIQGVIFFAAALPFFFLLIRRLFGEVTALWATFFYAFAPLSIVASREFIPDVPSLSLALAGVYFFLLWAERGDRRALLGSALLISVSFLIKLPTAVIAAPLQDLLRRLGTNWELWLFGAISLVPCAIWYWHAHRIAETFYPYHFFGGGGFRIMNAAWYWKIATQTVLSSMTPVLFLLAAIGALVAARGRFTRLFHWWLAAMVVFVFVVGWGNRHQWYQLPLVPIAAAFAGCTCQWVASRFRSHRLLATLAGVVVAAAFAILSYQSARPFYWPAAAGLRNLGLELKEATTPAAVIIAADDGDPTVFYYAHRKGWHFLEDGIYQGNPIDSAQIIANLEKLRSRGATHLVFYAGTRWWLDYYREFAEHLVASATLVEETPEFTIYKLAPATAVNRRE